MLPIEHLRLLVHVYFVELTHLYRCAIEGNRRRCITKIELFTLFKMQGDLLCTTKSLSYTACTLDLRGNNMLNFALVPRSVVWD